MAHTVDEMQRALDRISNLSRSKCLGVSDRKRLLQQIEIIANEARDGLVLSRDEKEIVIGLRSGACKVVL